MKNIVDIKISIRQMKKAVKELAVISVGDPQVRLVVGNYLVFALAAMIATAAEGDDREAGRICDEATLRLTEQVATICKSLREELAARELAARELAARELAARKAK